MHIGQFILHHLNLKLGNGRGGGGWGGVISFPRGAANGCSSAP